MGRRLRHAGGIALLAAAALAARAEAPADRVQARGLPPGVSLSAQTIRTEEKDGSIVAEGAVTIETGIGRFQADRISFRGGRFLEAEGNVLVVWGQNRISGTNMFYDMGVKDDPDPEKRLARGTIENAYGQVEPEFYFSARKVETIGQDRVLLYDASVTTCTQPTPHWSFAVSKAKIKLDGYAHLFNLRPRIKKVPFFYLPYVAWPVKRDRAPGLLFPEFGTTATRGELLSIPVFIPLGASADVTVFGEYYTEAGWGGGAKFRAIPNRDGYAEAQAQFIADQVSGDGRYRVLLKQTQGFLNGFRMVSDVDIVSDFDYYTDFVRNLTYASSPTILGRMSFTRTGSWTSLMIQEQYREQLFADGSTLVQNTFPEIEWRGRSRQLGKSPVYLSYVSSLAFIQQKGDLIDAEYWRADVGPTLSVPFSPAPWVDITPSVSLRETYWTEQLNGDGGLNRGLLGGAVDIRGPKLYKIFQKKDDPEAAKYKNTIEPRVVYTYQQAYDRNDEIIVYDEVDRFGFNANTLTYGLASRVIAQRPRALPEPDPASAEKILVPETDSARLREAPSATPNADAEPPPESEAAEAPRPLEPIEIASLEMSQSYSFNSDLSRADLDGDPAGDIEASSKYSGVGLTGRYNPSRNLSFNLTGRYDILYDDLSEVSLSGNFRDKLAKGLFSVVYRPGLGYERIFGVDPDGAGPLPAPVQVTERHDATQIRFQGDFGPIAGRLRLGVDGTMNLNPQSTEKRLPYRRFRVEYYTQCCGFLAEYLVNDYTAIQRNEFRFAVDLRGIGKLFDFSQGYQ